MVVDVVVLIVLWGGVVEIIIFGLFWNLVFELFDFLNFFIFEFVKEENGVVGCIWKFIIVVIIYCFVF